MAKKEDCLSTLWYTYMIEYYRTHKNHILKDLREMLLLPFNGIHSK